jgi:hypothetical protein
MNPRKRRQRIREALEAQAKAASLTEDKSDDEILTIATNSAKEKGILTEAEAKEILLKLNPPTVGNNSEEQKTVTTNKTKDKKVDEKKQTTTTRTKKTKTTKSAKKRTTKRTTKRTSKSNKSKE